MALIFLPWIWMHILPVSVFLGNSYRFQLASTVIPKYSLQHGHALIMVSLEEFTVASDSTPLKLATPVYSLANLFWVRERKKDLW